MPNITSEILALKDKLVQIPVTQRLKYASDHLKGLQVKFFTPHELRDYSVHQAPFDIKTLYNDLIIRKTDVSNSNPLVYLAIFTMGFSSCIWPTAAIL